jgi:hypothetical protein
MIDEGAADRADESIAGALEEYRSLRAEHVASGRTRLLMFGFSLIVLGGLAGYGLRQESNADLRVGVAAAILALIACAARLVHLQSQLLQVTEEYMARYVEPLLGSARWEQRRLELREAVAGRFQVNEAVTIGFVYLAATAGTLVVYVLGPAPHPAWGWILLAALAALATIASLPLVAAGRGGLGARAWDAYEQVAIFGPRATRSLWRWLSARFGPGRELAAARERASRRASERATSVETTMGVEGGAVTAAGGLVEHEHRTGFHLLADALSEEELQSVKVARQGSSNEPNPWAALGEIAELLGGGLGADGLARWLRAGKPSRLELLRAGRGRSVLTEARRYQSFPPAE